MSILRTGSIGLEQQHSYKKWSSSEYSFNDVIARFQSIYYFHKTRKSFALYEGPVIFCRTSQQPLVAQGLLLFIVSSRSHSDTQHSVGLLWKGHQPETKPLHDNTQHSQEPDINGPGGIRNHNSSKRATAGPCLKPRGHWNRIKEIS